MLFANGLLCVYRLQPLLKKKKKTTKDAKREKSSFKSKKLQKKVESGKSKPIVTDSSSDDDDDDDDEEGKEYSKDTEKSVTASQKNKDHGDKSSDKEEDDEDDDDDAPEEDSNKEEVCEMFSFFDARKNLILNNYDFSVQAILWQFYYFKFNCLFCVCKSTENSSEEEIFNHEVHKKTWKVRTDCIRWKWRSWRQECKKGSTQTLIIRAARYIISASISLGICNSHVAGGL